MSEQLTPSATTYRVVVAPRTPANDQRATRAAAQLGIAGVQAIYAGRLYFVRGDLTADDIARLADELLADPVTEDLDSAPLEAHAPPPAAGHQIDVTLLPGVTDPAAENLVRAANLLGLPVQQAATGQRYTLSGDLDAAALQRLAHEVLANPVVQQVAIDRPIAPPFVAADAAPADDAAVEVIALSTADDATLLAISRARRLALDLAEMQAIRAWYAGEGREPTDVELEMLAQTWSEHCVHKTFKALIDYSGPNGERETIDGLLNTYIRAATDKINKPWVRSAFVDDAGIIRFDDRFDVAFKVETHNHPSALEPFGGANTGVGGVIRDILGVSARPIANTDILCFGPPDLPPAALPAGVLHPTRIADGVIHGIEDYGNKMGIPTVNGSIVYHPGYTANPLVYCGCVGILPHGSHRTGAQAGDLIVAIGGRVGRDGLRGATFSSMEMDQTTGDIAGTAVQIGHPIMEKQVLELVLRCRDAGLYNAITDCGAGGFSSSVGEMGEKVGATVQLDAIQTKYPGLRPWELWLSEAQERMVLAVPPANWPQVQALAAGQNVEAVILGTFEPTGRMTIYAGARVVGDISMAFLHNGIPQRRLTAVWQAPQPGGEPARELLPAQAALLRLLAHPTVRSKEDVVRRYDHEVQTGTAGKPLVGVANHAPADASVIVPQETLPTADGAPTRAFAVANGICPTYGVLDPYAMAWAAVDEAFRNLVAVGANPDEVAILDNFCWGNPSLPDRLGALVRCAQGCHDAAVAYRAPFISGKDSLNNEYVGADGEKHAIPGTILISALGMVPDVAHTLTSDLKAAGNLLYIVGETRAEMGGALYALLHGEQGGTPPQPLTAGLARYRALHRAIRSGWVQACHDLSEGGLGVALAEMAIGGRLGASIDLRQVPANVAHDALLLFSESSGRFLLEVRPEDAKQLEFALTADHCQCIGAVNDDDRLLVRGYAGATVVDLALSELEQAWRGHVDAPASALPVLAAAARPAAPALQTRKRVIVLHANGTNRDRDAALACQLAGGAPEIVHLNQLLGGERRLSDYHMLVVPGGFSYGDDLGAGVLFSAELRHRFGDALRAFVADGRPTIGICNGFQALVKANVFDVDNRPTTADRRQITLTFNAGGHFECRWVRLLPNPASVNLFTRGLDAPIDCPVAHGEGRLMLADDALAAILQRDNLIALTYAGDAYPANPNGSALAIAGISNRAGNVLGLMPHPENHIFPWQHPQHARGAAGLDGLRLFENGIRAA